MAELRPFLAPTLIFFGLCRLYFYYSTFNINIINYITFQEAILSFLDILILKSAYIVYILLASFFTKNQELEATNQEFYNKYLSQNNLFKRLWLFFKRGNYAILIITIVVLTVSIINNYKFQCNIGNSSLLPQMFFLFIIYLLFKWEILRKCINENFEDYVKEKYNIMLLFLFLFGSVYILAKNESQKVLYCETS